MKYFVTLAEQTYEIAIDGQGRLRVDGVEMQADMQPAGAPEHLSLLIENASHEAVVEPEIGPRNTYSIQLAGKRYVATVQDERTHRLASADRSLKTNTGELAIKPPIPGLVIRVPVAPGQTVAEGDTLIILEAMKMENDLRAPRAGVVHDVRVAPGDQVKQGQVLLTLR